MSVSFDPGLGDDISKVRQLIGDQDGAETPDETIEAYLAMPWSVTKTAMQLAYDISAKYASANEYTVDNQRNDNRAISANYKALADRLYAQVQLDERTGAAPGAFGAAIMVTGLNDHRGPLAGENWWDRWGR
jgi:hypothetical protein